ncbi:MAG: hypothetical protein A2014_10160 [Spirochaetes bacterium GWF1_49_6]|nr:MAG: hypothetical protein A2014_10160 [Spirochaetes bacterium GWF1_49_6]
MGIKSFLYNTRKNVPVKRMQKIFFALLVMIGIVSGYFIAQIIISFEELSDIRPLETYSMYSVPTKVYDIKGRLITEFFYQKRELVSYNQLPEQLIQALIATEDQEFYNHHGFNPWAMFKGVFINPFIGKDIAGGSGITQQLAKVLFTEGEKTVFRKLIELWYAVQIEKKYSKEEILELYFNQMYFGHGCYGIEAAALFFFQKSVSDLNLAEASFLVGLVQAPSRYSPIFQPYLSQKRHWTVLVSMVSMGFITQDEAQNSFENFWENYTTSFKTVGVNASQNESNVAPFFSEYVRKILIEKYGEEEVYTGGLQVYTTLDLDKQVAANEELKKGLDKAQATFDSEFKQAQNAVKKNNEDLVDMLSLVFGIDSITLGEKKSKMKLDGLIHDFDDVVYLSSYMFGLDQVNIKMKQRNMLSSLVNKNQDQIEGALISINPKNGYIEAMVGGKEFNYGNQFNRAVQAYRQMGSSFKPIYYAVAIDARLITPATVFQDMPIYYENQYGQKWIPRNYSGNFKGAIRVRTALQFSVNIVAVQVWDLIQKQIGYGAMVHKIGLFFGLDSDQIQERVKPDMAFSLGVGIFSPLEVCRAFATFANNGQQVLPIAILKVKDRYGRIKDDFESQRDLTVEAEQVISPGAACLMQDLLMTVLFNGTGAEAVAQTGFYGIPAGGKTGTTANWKDAWFAGFTPNLATVVWMGFDDSTKSLGRHQMGGKLAAPIWMNYMKKAMKYSKIESFAKAGGVQASICADTGLLPTPYCPNVIVENFLAGTVPSQSCTIHTSEDYKLQHEIGMETLSDFDIVTTPDGEKKQPGDKKPGGDKKQPETPIDQDSLDLGDLDLNMGIGD